MKKKIIFCLLSLSLMIAGCQSNEIEDITPPSKEVQLSPEELLSIRYKSSPELSQTEVFNLLTTFQSSELKNNAHSRITFQPNIFQIKEKYYLSKNKADARNIESTYKPQNKMFYFCKTFCSKITLVNTIQNVILNPI